ncbi:MAG: V-type ATP synthase subunit D [Corallococcus sp.]|nr:V-type ATP synthase subunit D [Corallococcus sp.]MCM1359380.1 V-type ATP synthase subunit D [Corallococcus sp.]MCM1394823.1 V-type ATP synthase subunit D [Corallococcus sp.]
MNVNPTRMEMKRLQARLKTATRGHKLLKDKTDEMIRRFITLAEENKRLRKDTEAELAQALANFTMARTNSDARFVEEAVLMAGRKVTLTCGKRKVMGIDVPAISVEDSGGELYPYSFLSVTEQLDGSVRGLNAVLYKLIKLAETEKTCNMLADEIEKNKRRVNALENIMIPQLTETIKYIKMKLDESERSATVRLMKVKDIIN